MPHRSLRNPTIAVIAMGDLGRSPRMLNHAMELARQGWDVELIGLDGTPLSSDIEANVRIHVCRLRSYDGLRSSGGPGSVVMFAFLRLCFLGAQLLRVVLKAGGSWRAILVQCPPAFPALPVVLLAARLRRAPVTVDWHNTTEAMLARRLKGSGGGARIIARLVGWAEGVVARRAASHLCVTGALRGLLAREHRISAELLPDRPTDRFRHLDPREASDFIGRHQELFDPAVPVVICPSSWSVDDDFDLLFDALGPLDRELANGKSGARRILILLTGEGERRAEVEERMAAQRLLAVGLRAHWFAPDDYCAALACAQLGLSLHRSASGADLPIKLVELLACGVPVCALDDGPAVHESVGHERNGLLFHDAPSLAGCLMALFGDPLHGGAVVPETSLLARLQAVARAERTERWEDAWARIARPLMTPREPARPPV